MPKSKQKKSEKSKVKVEIKAVRFEYPAIDIDKAVELTKRAYTRGKDSVMTFEEINRHMDVKGGSRSTYMNALRLYGLVEKIELGWQITEVGKRIAIGDIKAIASSFFKPELNKLISDSFKRKKPTLESLIAFLKKQKVKSADVVARRYLQGFEYVSRINPYLVTLETEKAITEAVAKREAENLLVDSDIYKMAIKIGQLFKPSEEDIKSLLEELLKMAEEREMKQFAVIIRNLKEKSESINDEQLKDELKSISDIAIQIFENELDK